MRNFETEWNEVADRRFVSYTNLNAGSYFFEVKAANSDGVWSNKIKTIKITIIPPVWERWWFRILGILLVLFLIFLFIKLREKNLNQQKEVLEKTVVERTIQIEKEREIVEEHKERLEIIHYSLSASIDYAEKIQSAILPAEKLLEDNLSDHFMLYKPRDVVSGDFYWWAEVDDLIVIAVADCTGHGVPGAFMSMLGLTFLREIVTKENITQPNLVLNRLRQEVIHALKQKGTLLEPKDGMDMSLITINKKTKQLQYAGAFNPIYIIRDNELIEIKADKMPVAIYMKMNDFSLHEMQLQANDSLYLFSDGYYDQFGGKYKRKFMAREFKTLLKGCQHKSMPQQKELLNNTLKEWMGTIQQIDDIVVLGLKI